ncbi:MAG: endopeptidase La [Clostridia bacterium]|nr:endopeptidase La [Clostridia bacterium]
MPGTVNVTLPVVALRGIVVFPDMCIHFEVGRKKSIAAVMAAMNADQRIFLTAQRSIKYENPKTEELYNMGVIARVRQVIKSPGSDSVRVVVEGIRRACISETISEDPYIVCKVRQRNGFKIPAEMKEYSDALVRKAKDYFEQYAQSSAKLAADVAISVAAEDDPGVLADCIASNAFTDVENRQAILSELNRIKRLEKVCVLLAREADILEYEADINERVQQQIDKNQREYYLREQLKVINEELGDSEDACAEADEYREKIKSSLMSDEAKEKLLKECDRLRKMQAGSPEATVSRCYLDSCLLIPWGKYTEDDLRLPNVKKILEQDHYGLEKVKKRFTEMIAVKALAPDIKGQIICLAGPPGVGKTSVAKSVARAMNRKFVRISLGGIRDEAEIRGHRKTYIGSMPGRIVTALQQAGSMNPIILLDEIDKLGFDYKGDPSGALLEALDSEQNFSFSDNYIGFPVDLSRALFITTANDFSAVPQPLADRMELIELSGYTLNEKLNIAKKHLVKQQMSCHGLDAKSFRISDEAIKKLIDGYTREAGVRKLKQRLAEICRRAAVDIVGGKSRVGVGVNEIEDILGPVKFRNDESSLEDKTGVVNGLAWTAVGGEMLTVEALILDGTGKIELTGSLGDVMKESAMAAVSYIRSVAGKYNIDSEFYKKKDIHIHVPQGAVPKDGPSAGVTIATALLSALSGRSVKGTVAMTGEISLTGRVMAIGGLKEKTMAAYLAGIKQVIIPTSNASDLWEVEDIVKENVEFIFADRLNTVFDCAIVSENTPQQGQLIMSEAKKRTGRARSITQ